MSSSTEPQNRDVALLWENARRIGTDAALKSLHERSIWRSVGSICGDWCLIIAAIVLVQVSAWWIAPALLVVGNRQRALVVLIHDASHYLLTSRKPLNDALARLFLCWPMFISLTHYRKLHAQHHRYLGDPKQDTDYLHDEVLAKQGWWALYRRQLLGSKNARTAVIGQLTNARLPERGFVIGWWVAVLSVLYFATSASVLLSVLGIWFAARLFVYHPIISFVIISDHVGLKPGTVLSFTRNHPAGIRSWLLHPHANGWHLTHHLLPGVPCHQLALAHALLMNWPAYAASEHCNRYFWGDKTVLRSWGRCATVPLAAVSQRENHEGRLK